MKRALLICALIVSAFVFSACAPKASQVSPQFHAEGNPETLAEWGVVSAANNQLIMGDKVIAYDLNTPLFSDYAHKLRTVWMPDGTSAEFHAKETFDFPVGTIISKTFYYSKLLGGGPNDMLNADVDQATPLDLTTVRMIETRILAKRADGWAALPYVWNEAQTEARLKRIGAILPLTLSKDGTQMAFNYVVPNQNQCAGCHATNATTKELLPIGPKARHLNKRYPGEAQNQLAVWSEAGYLKGVPEIDTVPNAANWLNMSESLNNRARAYLDINCAHCHNTEGPADTSGLHYEPETKMGPHLGRCKSPVAAGRGTGDRLYDLVPGAPEQSVMLYRVESTDPGEMMPELGRSLVHAEGAALLKDWISDMEGSCESQ